MKLTWHPTPGGFRAQLGKLHVGHVVRTIAPTEEYAWEIYAVHTKHICTGHGSTASIKTAKAALERNWQRWLDYAGLEPK